jgi:HNH endonuclease
VEDGGFAVVALQAWVELISSLDVSSIPPRDLPAVVLKVEQLCNAANALSAVVLHEFEHGGGWAADGAPSAAAWTAERTGSARSGLRSRARQGAALSQLASFGAEARDGRLSPEHLRAAADCARRHPDLTTEHEPLLVEQASTLGAEAFRLAARHWLAAAEDVSGAEPEWSKDEVSRLHASRAFDGWLRLDGLFAPHDACLLEAALDGGVDRALRASRDGDPSVEGLPASALRAGVLVDLAARSMRQEPSDASVPDRYRVAVVVRAGDPVEPAEAACDAVAYRAVLAADGEVLDIGRQTGRWPIASRRAITLRDRGCTFPNCDRPPSWTDIHHCTPWSEGGTTSLDNGVLLCRRHHGFVHRQRWNITIEGGTATFRRPDGSPHVVRRWHAAARAS